MNILDLTRKLGLNKKKQIQKHKCIGYMVEYWDTHHWYVYVVVHNGGNGVKYLHNNGFLHGSTIPFNAGYYPTKEEAYSAAQKYLETVC